VTRTQAADLRKKFPRAYIIGRGKGAAGVNAILVDDLDLKKPDDKAIESLKDAHTRYESPTLAVFVSDKKEDGAAAAALAKSHRFLFAYVSPDKDHSALAAPRITGNRPKG
jgi:hypothetical protein